MNIETRTVTPPLCRCTAFRRPHTWQASRRHLDDQIAEGTGPAVTRIGRRVLISDEALRKWVSDQTEAAVSPNRDQQTDAALTVLAQ